LETAYEHVDRIAIDPLGRDIPAESARLRALGAGGAVELPGGIPAWAPTGYDTLRSLILDPRVSRDPRAHWSLWPEVGRNPAWGWILGWLGAINMITSYGLTTGGCASWSPPASPPPHRRRCAARVEAITADLLDELEAAAQAAPGAPVDLRAGYASPLPMRVISELFGVPDHLRASVATWINAIMDTSDTGPEHAAFVMGRTAPCCPRSSRTRPSTRRRHGHPN